jgi:N-acetylglucosaminyl-diphospho-decaprenol L-rhamnosyltransferase
VSREPDSLSIVIVTYNSCAFVAECLESVLGRSEAGHWQVIVVDNDSRDGSAEMVKARFPQVELLEMGANVGFGAANNQGLLACTAPYVLLLNPDTRLDGAGMASLVAFMDRHPAVGLVGPRLVGADQRLQTSTRHFPSIAREAVECLFLHRVSRVFGDKYGEEIAGREAYDKKRRVDWVSGAAMLARVEALRAVGGFDEGFFLYAEEIDLCKRLGSAGWDVWYHPGLTVMHVGNERADPELEAENQRSKLRYFRKHHGRAAMLAFGLVMVLRLAIRSIAWVLASTVKGRPWLRRSKAAMVTLVRYPALVLQALSAECVSATSLPLGQVMTGKVRQGVEGAGVG